MALTAHSQDFRYYAPELARRSSEDVQEQAIWSTRRMLAVSAVLSVGLWTPILFLVAKAVG